MGVRKRISKYLPLSLKNYIWHKYKASLRFYYKNNVIGSRLTRKILTSNFSSKKIALGEQNIYDLNCHEWVTVDIEHSDFNVNFRNHEKLPFADNSRSIIYSSHMIEHIDHDSLIFLLQECYRILEKGGAIRLEAPDSEKLINAYKNNDREFLDPLCESNKENSEFLAARFGDIYSQEHVISLGFISCYVDPVLNMHVNVTCSKEEFDEKINTLDIEEFGQWCLSLQTPEQFLSGGHVNPLYPEKMFNTLNAIGFKNITFMENCKTNIKNFEVGKIERFHRGSISFYVEAYK